jgi:DNA polymerase III delta' subunit
MPHCRQAAGLRNNAPNLCNPIYFRPMGFSAVRDQEVPVRLLHSMMTKNRIPNGLLFWGPSGVGKRFAALEAAKAINCERGAGDACDECLSCRKTAHGTHPDLKQVVPAGKARIIKVEAVDAMNELCAYRPFEGRYRIFIIEEAERMGISAQNHFLKTLEEPPSATVFMLLSEYPRQLLPTVRSRCQHLRFGALQRETVKDLLLQQRPEVPVAAATALAAVSQGQMSRALDLVDSSKREVVLNATARLAAGEDPLLVSEQFVRQVKADAEALKDRLKAEAGQEDRPDMTREEKEEAKEEEEAYLQLLVRRDLMEYLYLLAAWVRDEFVVQAAGPDLVWNQDQRQRLIARAEAPPREATIAAIEQAWVYIERNLSVDRVFRDLFFALSA